MTNNIYDIPFNLKTGRYILVYIVISHRILSNSPNPEFSSFWDTFNYRIFKMANAQIIILNIDWISWGIYLVSISVFFYLFWFQPIVVQISQVWNKWPNSEFLVEISNRSNGFTSNCDKNKYIQCAKINNASINPSKAYMKPDWFLLFFHEIVKNTNKNVPEKLSKPRDSAWNNYLDNTNSIWMGWLSFELDSVNEMNIHGIFD